MQKREEENVYTSREVADMVRFPFRIALYALVSWQGFNYIATAASLPAVGFWHSLGLVSILAYLVALVKGAGNAKKE